MSEVPRRAVRVLSAALMMSFGVAAGAATPAFQWSTVVNNGDYMPTETCTPSSPTADCRQFNSYNQPSVNRNGLVVMRARSAGEQGIGQPIHGIYTRDMEVPGSPGPIVKILDRDTLVPQPNNLESTFVETPTFPRIGMDSDTIATRANEPPSWEYTAADGTDTRAGTTGIYTDPFGPLITGASNLGAVPLFSFFQVPELPGVAFDVFPGAPSVAGNDVIVFKGNYTEGDTSRTGVYFRRLENEAITGPDGEELAPAGGESPLVPIANTMETVIPGTGTLFGSTAPPSAAGDQAVFAGFDNEDDPTTGGIYLARLVPNPPLKPLVTIGGQVPGEPEGTGFQRIGEGLSFGGRFVAFWGAWDVADSRPLVLHCPTEGNKDLIAYCEANANDFTVQVPVHQGIFVHDDATGQTYAVAKTGEADSTFDDFLYWNYSGRVPGTGESEEPGEPPRWRSAAFVAVSGAGLDLPSAAQSHALKGLSHALKGLSRAEGATGGQFRVAFKARTGDLVDGIYADPVDGIYLAEGPGSGDYDTLIETGMEGPQIDPQAVDPDTEAPLPVTEMGIERDGFRGDDLVITATMGNEEASWSGVYLARISAAVALVHRSGPGVR